MLQEEAIQKAADYFDLIGKKFRHIETWNMEVVTRVTAIKMDENSWEVGMFFYRDFSKHNNNYAPDCTLDDFLTNYVEFD